METTTSGQVVKFLRLSIHKHIARRRVRGVDKSRIKVNILLPMVLILLGGPVDVVDEDLYPLTDDAQPINHLSMSEMTDLREHIQQFREDNLNWPPARLTENLDRQPAALRSLLALNDRVTELTDGNQRDKERILVPFFLLAALPNEEVGGFSDDVYPKQEGQPIRSLSESERCEALTLFEKEWDDSRDIHEDELSKVEGNLRKIRSVVTLLRTSIKKNVEMRNLESFDKLRWTMAVLLPMAMILLPNTELEVLKYAGVDTMYPTDEDGQQIRILSADDVEYIRPFIVDFQREVAAGSLWPSEARARRPPPSCALRTLTWLSERVNVLTEGEDAQRRRQEILIPFFLLALPNEMIEHFPDDLYPKDPPQADGVPIRTLPEADKQISRDVFEKYWNTYRMIYNEHAVKIRVRRRLREQVQ